MTRSRTRPERRESRIPLATRAELRRLSGGTAAGSVAAAPASASGNGVTR